MAAPVASGWSVRRVGLAPTGKRRLSTAHTLNGHSMTSSASASRFGGTSRPSALAVLRFDHQLVLGRRLHRKVGRLVALEDSVDVAARERIGTPINFHVLSADLSSTGRSGGNSHASQSEDCDGRCCFVGGNGSGRCSTDTKRGSERHTGSAKPDAGSEGRRAKGRAESRAESSRAKGRAESRAESSRAKGRAEGRAESSRTKGRAEGRAESSRTKGRTEGRAESSRTKGRTEGRAESSRTKGRTEGRAEISRARCRRTRHDDNCYDRATYPDSSDDHQREQRATGDKRQFLADRRRGRTEHGHDRFAASEGSGDLSRLARILLFPRG